MLIYYLQLIDDPKDQNKFEQIYHRYRNPMIRRAYKILHNFQDAEDAVHEAFLTISKNMKKISDPECHETRNYIVTIIESKAIDIYRKQTAHPTENLIEALEYPAIEKSGDGALASCIVRLPDNYRNLIYLKYEQGFSNQEISKMLGIQESSVRKLDQRAKEKLVELCREEGLEI